MLPSESVVESSEVMPLFPTFVWKTQLQRPLYERINAAMHQALQRLTAGLPPVEPGGKYQTEQSLHMLPEFAEFSEVLLSAAGGVLEFLKLVHTPMVITGCWANISAPGATHRPHVHPNNYLSAVYYLQADQGAHQITFDDPRSQNNVISPRALEMTAENADQIHIGIRPGMLVIFPAWLQHSVLQNRSTRNRISVACNLMFTRYGEDMAGPKWDGNVKVGGAGG